MVEETWWIISKKRKEKKEHKIQIRPDICGRASKVLKEIALNVFHKVKCESILKLDVSGTCVKIKRVSSERKRSARRHEVTDQA